jgi:O-antigen ligase
MTQGQFLEGSSMQGRYDVWRHLWSMIKEKPVFGHAPNKEFFYKNTIYAENEFILITWRYGFLGLAIFLTFIALLFRLSLKNVQSIFGLNLVLFLILFLVAGLTNNPFANKTVLVLFAIIVGLLLNEIKKKRIESEDSIR